MEQQMNHLLKIILWSFFISCFITMTSMYISSMNFHTGLYSSYFIQPVLLLLNFLPVFLLMIILGLIFNSIRAAFVINFLLFNILGYVNYLKIIYRQEPLKASDYQMVREGLIMARQYPLKFNIKTILLVLAAVGLIVFISNLIAKISLTPEVRALALISIIALGYVFTRFILFNYSIYESQGEGSGLNTWQELQGYQARGFAYPLLFTVQSARGYVYKDYDEDNAKRLADKYEDWDIPDNKKLNIVVIMLESYKDFYKFSSDSLKFNINPYEYLYELKEESIWGSLLVDTFGGGTLNSETAFLSGYRHSPNYNVNRNTYVSYLKSQGYKTEALHPSDGHFNNRINFYPRLGFEKYYNIQNYFESFYTPGYIITDDIFFPELFKIYKEGSRGEQPYFSFSITYENHGPYATDNIVKGTEYIEFKEGYDLQQYNSFNNYLHGINNTTNSLKPLVESFKQDEEPVILVLFGDHSPSMGDNAIGMEMMGIEHNLGTIKGAVNTYETTYIIWANESAKILYQKSFVGKGPTLDTHLLMAYVFKELGWKGSSYNSFLQDYMNTVTVAKTRLFKEWDVYKQAMSPIGNRALANLKDYEYYYSNIVRE